MHLFLLISSIFILTTAISEKKRECYTCDNFCDCLSPKKSVCPLETFCYALLSTNSSIVHMGCSLGCDSVNSDGYKECYDCFEDFCIRPNLDSDVDIKKCLNRKYRSIKRNVNNDRTFETYHSIGNGANPNSHEIGSGVDFKNDKIGQGANPGAIGIGSGIVPENNNIGQGVNLNNDRIGQGANPGAIGIGSGIVPEDNNIGRGVNPDKPSVGGGVIFQRSHRTNFDDPPNNYNHHIPREISIGNGAVPQYRTPIGQGANPSTNDVQKILKSNLLYYISLCLVFVYFF
uniref:Snake toxin/toxin-like domain-containing protein n=2 Tax=Strongyloides stercoralis TaxID=6248 RepID=A0A0K0EP44_STRER